MKQNGINVKLGLNNRPFQAGLRQSASMAGGFAGRMTSLLMSPTGAFIALGAAAVLASKKAITAWARFEYKMAEVATIVDTNVHNMEAMGRAAQAIAKERGFDTKDVGGAFYQAISAGMDPAKVEQFTRKVADLAKGGFIELEDAVKVTAGTMNAYQNQNVTAQQVTDSLFNTVKQGITTMSELSGAMGRVNTIAATLGIKIEDTAAAVALLTKNNLKTEVAVTGLRAMLMELIRPGDEARAIMDEYGMSITEASFASRGLTGVLDDIGRAYDKDNKVLKKLIRSQRAYTAATVLVPQRGEHRRMFEEQLSKKGVTAEAAAKEAATTQSGFDKIKAKWKIMWETMGKGMLGTTGAMTNALKSIIGGLDTFLNKWEVIGRAITMVQSIWAAFVAIFKYAVGAIIAGIGRIVAGFHALGVMARSVWDRINQAGWLALEAVIRFAKGILDVVKAPFKWIADHFDPLGIAAGAVKGLEKAQSALDAVADDFGDKAEANATKAKREWTRAVKIMSGETQNWYELMAETGGELAKQAKNAAKLSALRTSATFATKKNREILLKQIAELEAAEAGLAEASKEAANEMGANYDEVMKNMVLQQEQNIMDIKAKWNEWRIYFEGDFKKQTALWQKEYNKRIKIVEQANEKIKSLESERQSTAEWGEKLLFSLRTGHMNQVDKLNEAMKMYGVHMERAARAAKTGDFEEAARQGKEAIGYLQQIAAGDKGIGGYGAYQEIERMLTVIDNWLSKAQEAERAKKAEALRGIKALEEAWKKLEDKFKRALQIKVDVGAAMKALDKLRDKLIEVYNTARDKALEMKTAGQETINASEGRDTRGGMRQFNPPAPNAAGLRARTTTVKVDNINIKVPEGSSREEIREVVVEELNTAMERARWDWHKW